MPTQASLFSLSGHGISYFTTSVIFCLPEKWGDETDETKRELCVQLNAHTRVTICRLLAKIIPSVCVSQHLHNSHTKNHGSTFPNTALENLSQNTSTALSLMVKAFQRLYDEFNSVFIENKTILDVLRETFCV